MVFLRGFTKLDHRRNSAISDKLKVNYWVDDIKLYQEKWLQHIEKITSNRISKLYKSICKRDLGRWQDLEHHSTGLRSQVYAC